MDNIINKDLYEIAKKKADDVYERNSAYKSMYINKLYKELGGKYKSKNKPKKGLNRWLLEQWIELRPYLENDEIVICGSNDYEYKACRPLYRIDDETPITIGEILEMHNKKDVLKLVKQKEKDMNGRINWHTFKFYPSK